MSKQEDILAGEILADADKRAGRALQRAEREAKKILADARKEAEQALAKALNEAGRLVERMRHVARARVEQDVQALHRQAQADAVLAVRALALDRLRALAGADEYRQVLVNLAVLAIGAMTGEDFELLLREEDEARFGTDLPALIAAEVRARLSREARLSLGPAAKDSCGGLIVRGAAGRQVADQTFEARIERLWEELREPVAAMLFDADRAHQAT